VTDQEHPLEPFKRAMTATMRALSGNDELDVSFGQGAPTSSGNHVRVPLPVVGCASHEVDAVRGVGDEFALKMRYHDAALHRRRSPRSGAAQEMFQWIEDARIASLGSLRMHGVAQNLDASLESQCQEAAFDTITTETEAPLSVAVGLMVRQKLTGRELPPSAENVLRYWRDYIEERAGGDIESLRECVEDQQSFANVCREILADLGFAHEMDEPAELDENDQDAETVDESATSDAELSPEDVVLDEEVAPFRFDFCVRRTRTVCKLSGRLLRLLLANTFRSAHSSTGEHHRVDVVPGVGILHQCAGTTKLDVVRMSADS